MAKNEKVIGREKEKRILTRYFNSSEAEFLAIYGRRRVGKTFLIRNYFKEKGVFFEITGSFRANAKEQLENFHTEYQALFGDGLDQKPPINWREAFTRLRKSIEKLNKKQKVILFFDELPWLASAKSGFLRAMEHSWNRYFSSMSNILLIVSGSAASWMISHIVNNTGGLYGRLSTHLRLMPFTLSETEKYLMSRNITLTRKQICEIYMVTGGVPKYLSYIERGLSSVQNIHYLCFTPQAPLLTEFHKLYHSLFQNAENHLKIMKVLAKRRRLTSRSELLKSVKMTNSGNASLILKELEESGFIAVHSAIGKKTREASYYLNDEYTLFYLRWIEPEKTALLQGVNKEYWIQKQATPSWRSWAGFAFESLCLKHISEIKNALGISGVIASCGYWKFDIEGKKEGEIDLVIDRADQCINLCEIKFCKNIFVITKSYAETLIRKKNLFQENVQTNKGIITTLITPFGTKNNIHYQSVVDNQLTLDALYGNH